MKSFKRPNSSAFVRRISHAQQPRRSFVASKIVPVATSAAMFGMGYLMGSPASDYRMLVDGNPPTFVPSSVNSGASNNGRHTDAVRNGDYETDPTPAAYGAQLAKLITQEMIEVNRLIAEKRNQPSSGSQIDIQPRLVRLKSLYDAVWALHMIQISDDPKVWRLLDHNAIELNQPATDTVATLTMALEATASGDTRKLEAHIKKFIEENFRRGRRPMRPISELERFMAQAPAGSAVLSRLRMLQRVSIENTEESRLLTEDTMYTLWWVLEKKVKEFDRILKEVE